MNTIRALAAVAALTIATAMLGNAGAQDKAPPQDQSGGWIMGNWMMGPHGMMGYGGMGFGMMGWGGMGPGMMGSGMPEQAMCSAMAGHIDGRLAYLMAELKISDAQEALWKTYAAAARDNATTMLGHCTAMMGRRGGASSLPDRIDQHEQMMAAHLESLRALSKALKPLYAALDDGQKHIADQILWGHMGMM